MKFHQKKDGSCDIIFSDQEIEIISKHKKLFLPTETLRHFGNVLMAMVSLWNLNFNEEIANMKTEVTTPIEGKAPDDKD